MLVKVVWTLDSPCSHSNTSMLGGMLSALLAMCFSKVVFPLLDRKSERQPSSPFQLKASPCSRVKEGIKATDPFGPTKPYRLPATMSRSALTKSSLP